MEKSHIITSGKILCIKILYKKNKYAMTIKDSEGNIKEIEINNFENKKVNSIQEEHLDFYNYNGTETTMPRKCRAPWPAAQGPPS